MPQQTLITLNEVVFDFEVVGYKPIDNPEIPDERLLEIFRRGNDLYGQCMLRGGNAAAFAIERFDEPLENIGLIIASRNKSPEMALHHRVMPALGAQIRKLFHFANEENVGVRQLL